MADISLSSFVRGPAGPQGPPGPTGPALNTFDFVQASPDTTWTINHNLGFMPAVELRTIGGVEFDADVQHPNTNQTIVYLLSPLAGTARLN